MKKLLYLSILLLLCQNTSYSQQVFFSENFDGMAPGAIVLPWKQEFTSYPWQVAEPYLIGVYHCFDIPGTDGHNKVAGVSDCSTFSNGNNSNVLLKSPLINLTTTTHAFLQYDSYFLQKIIAGKTEQADLEVSLDSGATWSVVETISANPDPFSFKTHWVDISAFASNRIKLGFRYSDSNAVGVMPGWSVDNIKVFQPAQKDLALTHALPEDRYLSYVAENQITSIQGTVMNMGIDTINSFIIKYQEGSGPIQSDTVTGLHLATFDTLRFAHHIPYTMPGTGAHSVHVWVETPGDGNAANDGKNITLNGALFMPHKVMAVEQNTGTWNMYGPYGIVLYNQLLASDYEVNLVNAHGADPMEDAPYDSWLNTLGANDMSYETSIFIDRGKRVDPRQLITAFNYHANYFGFAALDGEITFVSPNAMIINAAVRPAVSLLGDYRLAVVVTENKVSGNDSTWNQRNYFHLWHNSGFTMGGYEDKPDPVPYTDMQYNYVARTIFPAAQGGQYTIPVPLYEGDSIPTIFNVPLDPSWNIRNMDVTILLINAGDSTVLNSRRLNVAAAMGVSNTASNTIDATVYPNPANEQAFLSLNLAKKTQVGLMLTDISGKTVWQQAAENMGAGKQFKQLPTSTLPNGLYLLNIQTGDARKTLKFVVIH